MDLYHLFVVRFNRDERDVDAEGHGRKCSGAVWPITAANILVAPRLSASTPSIIHSPRTPAPGHPARCHFLNQIQKCFHLIQTSPPFFYFFFFPSLFSNTKQSSFFYRWLILKGCCSHFFYLINLIVLFIGLRKYVFRVSLFVCYFSVIAAV